MNNRHLKCSVSISVSARSFSCSLDSNLLGVVAMETQCQIVKRTSKLKMGNNLR